MVSTVGLPPGAAPLCSSCGRAFAAPASPHSGPSSAAGAGAAVAVAVLGLAFFLVVAVGTGFFFVMKHGPVEMQEPDLAGAPAPHQAARFDDASREEAARLVRRLEDDDWSKVQNAWRALYAYDRRDHWGTFELLRERYLATDSRNFLWMVTGGMCEYYAERGEDAVVDNLLLRAGEGASFDTVCQSLERFPRQMRDERGEATGRSFAEKSLRILRLADDRIDAKEASTRLDRAIRSVSELIPPGSPR